MVETKDSKMMKTNNKHNSAPNSKECVSILINGFLKEWFARALIT